MTPKNTIAQGEVLLVSLAIPPKFHEMTDLYLRTIEWLSANM